VTTPDYQKALGRKIAVERRRRGLSQPELARMVDRSVAWVSQVERGVRKVDRMSVLEAVAAALEVPLVQVAARVRGHFMCFERRLVPVQLVEDPLQGLALDQVRGVHQRSRLVGLDCFDGLDDQAVVSLEGRSGGLQ